MLVLSRKEGERIQIGDDTWIVVGKVKGNRVSLGIDAPKGIAIRRSELVKCSESPNSQTLETDRAGHQESQVA